MRATKTRRIGAVLGAAVLCGTAAAEVADSSPNGFTLKRTITVSVEPAKAYGSLVDVASWWDPAHTYSGDAKNLSIDARPGGCFCERLPGGGVQHMTVVFASPGKTLRLRGGLGPLQSLGVSGSMTFELHAAEKGTKVDFTYAVGGHKPDGFADLAPIVDSVLGGQLDRFKKVADGGKP